MNDDDLAKRLRRAVPPWQNVEPRTDLWPRLLARLEDAPVFFGWFESVLAGGIAMALAIFPETIPWMLYHL